MNYVTVHKTKEVENPGKVIISPNAKKLTYDELCRCITGMALNDFIKAIRENRDGKYDSLYC